MHILIEALGINQPGGGRSATLNLLEELFTIDRENRYTVLLSRFEPSLSLGKHVRQMVIGDTPAVLSRILAQALVPLLVHSFSVDLLHHMKNLTVAAPGCPTVVTVFDLTILRHPELYPVVDVCYWRYIQPLALQHTNGIIAISETTASDIRHYYRLPDRQIDVVYPSIGSRFSETTGNDTAALRRYGIDGEFILHVGSISLKKNLLTLLKAFLRLRRDGMNVKLVLVGRVYQKGTDAALVPFIQEKGLSTHVIVTGPIPDDDLPPLYRSASVVAFPSLHEGFGIVPVEAMACGAPVVSSRGGSLEEVVGDGGWLLHNAQDDQELAEVLSRILNDDPLRHEMIARGLARAKCFNRERAARQTIELYRRTVPTSC